MFIFDILFDISWVIYTESFSFISPFPREMTYHTFVKYGLVCCLQNKNKKFCLQEAEYQAAQEEKRLSEEKLLEKESHFQTMEEELRHTREQADRDKEALEAAIASMHVKEEAENDVEESGGE